MSQNLPAIQAHIGLSDRAAIRSFLDELEAVAESCTVVSPAVTPGFNSDQVQAKPEKPETYLDAIAKQYSFSSPRSSFYKHDEAVPQHQMPKPSVPSGLMWQFNKTYKALLSSLSSINRKQ